MKIIHRGDDGYTDVIGARVPKDSHIIEFIGSIDELVSFLGIVKSVISKEEILRNIVIKIDEIQVVLMKIADRAAGWRRYEDELFNRYTEELEKDIKKFSEAISVNQCFVIPGTSLESSFLHFARTLCRYVERRAVALLRENIISKSIYIYLNRLSDLLYLYALYADIIRGINIECLK